MTRDKAWMSKLGWYVYAYVDPTDRRIFYVGKGKKARAYEHADGRASEAVAKRLRKLKRLGVEPQIDVLAYGLRDEHEAFRVEAAVIDAMDLKGLANQVRGWGAKRHGRISIENLRNYLDPRPVKVIEPALLIRLTTNFYDDMDEIALYENTRGVWNPQTTGTRVPELWRRAKFAFAIHDGIVQEVYRIRGWHRAGHTIYWTRPAREVRTSTRLEFVGDLAPASIRKKYRGRSLKHEFPQGFASPVKAVNCRVAPSSKPPRH